MSEYHGFSAPKRSLGQNFLRDANIARNIVAALDIQPGDKVLEIGPGRGALTKHIIERQPGRFLVLEKDDDLADSLSLWPNAPEIWRGDALSYPWEDLAADGPWKIVGNLPYNIASPLMWEIVCRASFVHAVFMVQLEVAQRVKATHGGKTYDILRSSSAHLLKTQVMYVFPDSDHFAIIPLRSISAVEHLQQAA